MTAPLDSPTSVTCTLQDWVERGDEILAGRPVNRVYIGFNHEWMRPGDGGVPFLEIPPPGETGFPYRDLIAPLFTTTRRFLSLRWPGVEFVLPQVREGETSMSEQSSNLSPGG